MRVAPRGIVPQNISGNKSSFGKMGLQTGGAGRKSEKRPKLIAGKPSTCKVQLIGYMQRLSQAPGV
jgi:hypothetical protein